jgi:stage V sporulation protein B
VFALVPSLITPISLALIPKLSAAVVRGDSIGESEITDRSLRLTAILGIPSAMGIALYSRQILELLFSGQDEAIDIAAPLLAVLGASVFFSGMITTTVAILQAYGMTVKPIISVAIGAAVKTVLAYLMIGNKDIGVMGAPISTLACDLTVTVINLAMIGRRAPKEQKFSSVLEAFGLPLVNSAASIAASFGVFLITKRIGGETLGFLAALLVAVAVYALLSLVTGTVNEQDINELPFGKKLLLKYKTAHERTVDK